MRDRLRRGLQPALRNITPILPPPGGEIRILTVRVDDTRDWKEAINLGAPNTAYDQDIRLVASYYQPGKSSGCMTEVACVNFGPRKVDEAEVVVWGHESHFLKPASSRTILSIGEQYPQLHREWNQECLFLAVQEYCNFDAKIVCPYLIYTDKVRLAALGRLDVPCVKSCWFAFVRK